MPKIQSFKCKQNANFEAFLWITFQSVRFAFRGSLPSNSYTHYAHSIFNTKYVLLVETWIMAVRGIYKATFHRFLHLMQPFNSSLHTFTHQNFRIKFFLVARVEDVDTHFLQTIMDLPRINRSSKNEKGR